MKKIEKFGLIYKKIKIGLSGALVLISLISPWRWFPINLGVTVKIKLKFWVYTKGPKLEIKMCQKYVYYFYLWTKVITSLNLWSAVVFLCVKCVNCVSSILLKFEYWAAVSSRRSVKYSLCRRLRYLSALAIGCQRFHLLQVKFKYVHLAVSNNRSSNSLEGVPLSALPSRFVSTISSIF